ncbi:MAG: metalloendopeptidase-like rane protein [Mycobacterium sp.]|jgi:hypothetical protein|nr:metalloendopeptidase-like rane protein [Mycobacterium sp.]
MTAHRMAVGPLDGLPERVAGAEPMGMPLAQRPGNRIIQDIGGGNFVLYAHLKPGSITAKVGNRLQTGQIIEHWETPATPPVRICISR